MYYWHLEAIYVPFNGLKISSKNYNQQILFGAQIVEVGRAAFCNSAWAQTDRRKTVSVAHLVPENWCNDILFWCSAFSLPSTGTFTFLFNNQKNISLSSKVERKNRNTNLMFSNILSNTQAFAPSHEWAPMQLASPHHKRRTRPALPNAPGKTYTGYILKAHHTQSSISCSVTN